MANPLPFKPLPHDPHVELERQLAAAPRDHAEALLVAYQLLQTAHDKGILDLVHGLVGGRDAIAISLAEGGKKPETIVAIRNAIAMAKILGSLNPAMLDHVAKAIEGASKESQQQTEAPGLWSLMKRAFSADIRRGLGFGLSVLAGLGKKPGSAE